MNTVLIVVLILATGFALRQTIRKLRRGGGCCGEHESVARKKSADRNASHYSYTVRLKLGGMTCDNCARRIANALNELEGTMAKVSFGSKTGEVRCKEKPDEQRIRQAVAKAGYVVMDYQEV